MKDIYTTFEFEHIRERLSHHAATELGKRAVRHLTMASSREALQEALDQLKEACEYCNRYARINIQYHPDLLPQIASLQKGGTGSKEFFYHAGFLLENIAAIKEEFKERDSFPLLSEYLDRMQTLPQVKQRIDRVLSPSLEILDSASSNLYRIRTRIARLESGLGTLSASLVDKYRNYLSDSHGALKNGIFTLMVKSTYKYRVPGVVHGVSDTGMTVFIEPQELLEVYNQIASLREEELQEIQAILRELSSFVAAYAAPLEIDCTTVAELDFLFAKASFAASYRGEIAAIADTPKLLLKNAAHPLIDPSSVVRNDFLMERERLMIITGPNAGGKTVALKVVGLLVLMHQCGLAIPAAAGGEISFFNHIFADIGDNQSILDNLSTFSSHMVSVREILEQVDETSLVIIDELGSGTSPLDGEALGLGIIDYLLKKRCFALLSSHYEAIKAYALENASILCASMIFNERELQPTYRLLLHVASSSYGIEVAMRLGIQEEVILRAKQYIEERKQSDKEIRLELLNQRLNETEKLKLELERLRLEAEQEKEQLRGEIAHQKDLRGRIVGEAEAEKQKIIDEAKEEIDRIFSDFRSLENKKLHQVIEAKRKIDEKSAPEEEEEEEELLLSPGDAVEITASKVRGKIVRLDRDRVSILTDAGMTIQAKRSGIRRITIVKPSRPKVYTPDFVASMKRVPTECNVIGLTVKEALEIIDKYLDDCVSVHYKQVRIIHGSGTGKLRSGVHAYLKKSVFVDSFRLGGSGEGGVGATVVTLK